MKNSAKLLAMLLSITFILASCDQAVDVPIDVDSAYSSYIVTLNGGDGNSTLSLSADAKVKEVLDRHAINADQVTFTYDKVMLGFAANLTDLQVRALKADKTVVLVEKDQEYLTNDNTNENGGTINAQTIPWGITAVGGSTDAGAGTGIAWIIDTGIDLTHPDLNVNTSLSKTFVTSGNDGLSANDLNGHGSHVAGIVGAKNNTIGSIGVCAGAELVAVKVLNYRGSGLTSQIVAGINYVAGKLVAGKLNVVNMSFGGSISTTMDNAVRNLATKGALIVIASGNSGANSNSFSPARVEANGVYTISAHDNIGAFATFSNYSNGPIDFSAPGVSIYSTYKNGGYTTLSGTSMAAPHVAGILLANNGTINWLGNVTYDKDAIPDKKAKK